MAVMMEKPHPTLPTNHKPVGGIPYRVQNGDNWVSVAQTHGMDAASLIFFNFATHEPKHVNYYLKHNVGCRTASPDHGWRATRPTSSSSRGCRRSACLISIAPTP